MWSVTCTDASAQQNVRDSSSFQNTKTQATIIIAEGVLTGDVTCKFNVTGSMNYNPSVKSSVAVDIRALPSPLEPAIVGGKGDFICLALFSNSIPRDTRSSTRCEVAKSSLKDVVSVREFCSVTIQIKARQQIFVFVQLFATFHKVWKTFYQEINISLTLLM